MASSDASPGFWTTLRRNLNFFRLHLLFFTFTPLIFSVILYASNGKYPIPYIDALFNSVSAVTVCGLATVNLSQLTAWQQVLLFIQMCAGSPVVVSWFMVYIRRHFFAKKFEYILLAEAATRKRRRLRGRRKPHLQQDAPELANGPGPRRTLRSRVTSLLRNRRRAPRRLSSVEPEEVGVGTIGDASSTSREEGSQKVRTDMIRRIDEPPKRVDPSGGISQGPGMLRPLERTSTEMSTGGGQAPPAGQPSSFPVRLESPVDGVIKDVRTEDAQNTVPRSRVAVSESDRSVPSGLTMIDTGAHQTTPQQVSPTSARMPRTMTVEFAPVVAHHYLPLSVVTSRQSQPGEERLRSQISRDTLHSRRPYPVLTRHPSHRVSLSIVDPSDGHLHTTTARDTGLGGFPMPHKLLGRLFRRLFPRAANLLRKTVTIPETTALSGGEMGRIASVSRATGNIPQGSKPVTYITFDAIVGRNSAFQMLTNEQLEELGGVEYRGLNALLWLVALYHIGSQLVSFIVIAPYMALPKWANDFVPPALIRPVASPWFSLFQVVSTYTNTGMSLVDQSMIPFQKAYPMIFFMVFLILAGNTGFPIFLRFMIWIIAKLIPTQSRLYETLHFLLDHPRRCFVYLFPAHQTWFLLLVLLLLNFIDFFCFMVLDIGNPEIESIPLGTRFAIGLLQSVDVRASGFALVPVSALAPAVHVMFVIMMYVSVYPIAMSVRSTNVYEEQSLGIFNPDDRMATAEHVFQTNGSRMAMWGRYLAMHARHQLSFDMWWLALALFLVCIIERDKLINPENQGWFTIFAIIFEIVSGYGSVGLSLGIPDQNYSFSGAFRPLSKLILCLVMIRGRHRGLPVAIDRAVVLPYEFERAADGADSPAMRGDERRSSRYSVGSPAWDPMDVVEREREKDQGVDGDRKGQDSKSETHQ